MQVFNRQVSARGLTVFGFETILISGSILIAAQVHGSFGTAVGALWKIVLATALCELCFYYNDLYDLTIVHSKSELLVRILQAAGAAAIVLAVVSTLLPSLIIGHGIFITLVWMLPVTIPAWRLAFDSLTRDPHLEERVRFSVRQAGTAFEFAIVSSAGRYLGGCGVNDIGQANRRGNIGYWVRTSEARRGVATAAVRLAYQWAMENTNLLRLEILIAVGNVASQRVAEKAGAVREGTLRKRLLLHDEPHDAVMFSLIR